MRVSTRRLIGVPALVLLGTFGCAEDNEQTANLTSAPPATSLPAPAGSDQKVELIQGAGSPNAVMPSNYPGLKEHMEKEKSKADSPGDAPKDTGDRPKDAADTPKEAASDAPKSSDGQGSR